MGSMEVSVTNLFCICFMTLAHVVPSLSRTTHLFGASPSGGLWGARMSTSEKTTERLSGAGFPPSLFNKHISTASFDPSTRHVLIETSSPHSLYFGPLCSAASDPPIFLTNISRVPLSHPDFGDCINCEATAFTVFYNKIYFLITGDYLAPFGGGLTRVVQIRKFKSCDDCSYTGYRDETDFLDVAKCSDVVIDIVKHTFDFVDDTEAKGGKHMAIQREDDESLSFFFQMGNITSSDAAGTQVVMTLWHANSKGYSGIIHEEKVDRRYESWDISSLGSVAVKDTLLCWTTGDRVFCGTFLVSELRNKKMLLYPGQTVAEETCLGPEREFLPMVSGVGIVKTGEQKTVVFGCYPQAPGTGGTGEISFKSDGGETVRPITTADGLLQAGALFIADRTRRRCDGVAAKNLPQICLGRVRTTPAPPTTMEMETEKPLPEKPDVEGTNEVEKEDPDKGDAEAEGKEVVGNTDNSASYLEQSTVFFSCLLAFISIVVVR